MLPFPNSALSAPVYNPSQDSVTLMLAHPVAWTGSFNLFTAVNPSGRYSESTTITDTSGNPVVTEAGGVLARFSSQGPLPNPLFNTFVQSRINQDLIPIAIEAAIGAENDKAPRPIHLLGTGEVGTTRHR